MTVWILTVDEVKTHLRIEEDGTASHQACCFQCGKQCIEVCSQGFQRRGFAGGLAYRRCESPGGKHMAGIIYRCFGKDCQLSADNQFIPAVGKIAPGHVVAPFVSTILMVNVVSA